MSLFFGQNPAFIVDLATRDASDTVKSICRRFGVIYDEVKTEPWFQRLEAKALTAEDAEQVDRAKFRLVVTERLLPSLAVQAEDLRVPYKDRVALLEFAADVGGLAKPPQQQTTATQQGFSVTINFTGTPAAPAARPAIDITPTPDEIPGAPPPLALQDAFINHDVIPVQQ